MTKSVRSARETLNLASKLRRGGMLKADWDPIKHPRWPARSPGGIGGEFAPARSGADDVSSDAAASPTIPAQVTIPAPLDMPFPSELPIPRPFEVVPRPLDIPDIQQREGIPQNPYPDRVECVEEWQVAERYCRDLRKRGLLGRGDYRGMGKSLWQCMMGQVSEACGGNSTSA
ncbi:MAG TPA: hypothetical protein VKY65_06815 [Alphaproteobacteria bacterium]|nr:hypothetical protein [Alphaproteobacteria bacterium]